LAVNNANNGTLRISSRFESIDMSEIPPGASLAMGSYNHTD
jgi:hypothetical protein